MHIITNPSTGEGRNVSFETNASSVTSLRTNENNSTTFNNSTFISNHEQLLWYMGQFTTPVTAVLEAYVLISFLIFFVMFMLCVHRHGCCHIFHRRRRRHRQRAVRYQQQMRVRAWEEEQANRIHDDDDEEGVIDGHEVDSLDTENGDRVQEIQRLERALRSAGIA
ncbi:hypothetical protein D6D06_04404 [Aureobasidium pullulans]|nr:hypothetical protein D6D06_04404 [Aureobasidium pullulans]